MQHHPGKPVRQASSAVKPSRRERLEEELRANLKRRKDQARLRASSSQGDAPAAPESVETSPSADQEMKGPKPGTSRID